MADLIYFRSLLVAASLLAGSAACTGKSETRQESDRAAEAVKNQVKDLQDESRDLAGENARELVVASNEFEYRKMVRIATLRAVHSVHASQPNIINVMAQSFALVERDRGEVNEKLVIFQMRLDEAGNAIQSLELVEATDWEARNDATSKALDRVEDAGKEVWESLNEADRTTGDRTSMR